MREGSKRRQITALAVSRIPPPNPRSGIFLKSPEQPNFKLSIDLRKERASEKGYKRHSLPVPTFRHQTAIRPKEIKAELSTFEHSSTSLTSTAADVVYW
jgi:hypothetical protein